MSKLLIVAREEIMYHLRQWTFYITILIMPLVFGAVGALPRLQNAAEQTPLPNVETILNAAPDEIDTTVGFVDHAAIITIPLPETKSGRGFKYFATEAAASTALSRDEIESFYVIAADYLQSGQVTQFSNNPQLLVDTDGALQRLLRENLLDSLNDPKLAARLDRPAELIRQGPPPPVANFIPADLDMGKLVSAGLVVGLFVYVMNVGGNLLLRALQREVRASVLEVMAVSTTAGQFIGGKLAGLTTLTLAQAGFTLLAGVLVYGQNPDGSGPAALPVTALILSVPYLVLGFLAYCAGIIGVAALWPDFRESGALLTAMRLLTLTPLIGALFILPNANSSFSIILTLFPVTSHLLMPFRLLLTDVSLGQWALGLSILLAWTVLWMWLSARLFRMHGLLTGRTLAPRLVWQALRG